VQLTVCETVFIAVVVQGSYVECTVPPHPGFDGVRNLTVTVDVVAVPTLAGVAPPSRGIGVDDLTVGSDVAMALQTMSVVEASVVSGVAGGSSSGKRLLNGLRKGNASKAILRPWAVSLYGFRMSYTYTLSERCGCDLDPASACDACGVCTLIRLLGWFG
jgi:hypothetical protein